MTVSDKRIQSVIDRLDLPAIRVRPSLLLNPALALLIEEDVVKAVWKQALSRCSAADLRTLFAWTQEPAHHAWRLPFSNPLATALPSNNVGATSWILNGGVNAPCVEPKEALANAVAAVEIVARRFTTLPSEALDRVLRKYPRILNDSVTPGYCSRFISLASDAVAKSSPAQAARLLKSLSYSTHEYIRDGATLEQVWWRTEMIHGKFSPGTWDQYMANPALVESFARAWPMPERVDSITGIGTSLLTATSPAQSAFLGGVRNLNAWLNAPAPVSSGVHALLEDRVALYAWLCAARDGSVSSLATVLSSRSPISQRLRQTLAECQFPEGKNLLHLIMAASRIKHGGAGAMPPDWRRLSRTLDQHFPDMFNQPNAAGVTPCDMVKDVFPDWQKQHRKRALKAHVVRPQAVRVPKRSTSVRL
jgi:hypothetical protein